MFFVHTFRWNTRVKMLNFGAFIWWESRNLKQAFFKLRMDQTERQKDKSLFVAQLFKWRLEIITNNRATDVKCSCIFAFDSVSSVTLCRNGKNLSFSLLFISTGKRIKNTFTCPVANVCLCMWTFQNPWNLFMYPF